IEEPRQGFRGMSYSPAALPRVTYRFLLRMPEELRRGIAGAAARSRPQPQCRAGPSAQDKPPSAPGRAAAVKAATLIRNVKGGRTQVLRPKHRVVLGAVAIPAALLIALLLAFAGGSGGTQAGRAAVLAKAGEGDADSAGDTPGLGPVSFDAYQAAE